MALVNCCTPIGAKLGEVPLYMEIEARRLAEVGRVGERRIAAQVAAQRSAASSYLVNWALVELANSVLGQTTRCGSIPAPALDWHNQGTTGSSEVVDGPPRRDSHSATG